jgi:hypothetical protein
MRPKPVAFRIMALSDTSPVPDVVVQTRPIEDSGSVTSGYYDYQYGWVAGHAFEMLRESTGPEWILCEWHTDFILGWGSSFAPVSVKHREPNSGRWTIATLFSDGGLQTLFARWLALGSPAECRWITNGGLDTECRHLQAACQSVDRAALAEFTERHGWRFDHADSDTVGAFLACLRINNESAPWVYQRIVNVEQHARPALDALGLSSLAAQTVYDEVLSMVRTASQGLPAAAPGTWTVGSPGALDEAVLLAATASRRLLTRRSVLARVKRIASPAAAEPPTMTPATTTLIKKLRRGRVVPTVEAAARRSRVQWTAYESSFTEPIPSDDQPSDFEALRAQVVGVAADAQLLAAESGEPYGDRMLLEVRRRMREVACAQPIPRGLSADLLMGLVYDLTARCEVWWSGRFDPTDEEPDGVAER